MYEEKGYFCGLRQCFPTGGSQPTNFRVTKTTILVLYVSALIFFMCPRKPSI